MFRNGDYMSVITKKAIWDYDYKGKLDNNNNIKYYENEDAVENAFLLWLQTEKGEILNELELGGSVSPYLFKQMNDTNKLKILFQFRAEIDNFFFPSIQIKRLDVESDKEKRHWIIKIRYFIKEFKKEKITKIPLERLKIKIGYEKLLEEISYTEKSLETFIKIYLYEMYNKSLTYNGSAWQWGDRFIFTNFKETNNNFEKIIDIINSNKD